MAGSVKVIGLTLKEGEAIFLVFFNTLLLNIFHCIQVARELNYATCGIKKPLIK